MNEPTILKRPKPSDGEEELFRMQEEFIKAREEPSAKVINLRTKKIETKQTTTESPKPTGKFRSIFAERKALKKQEILSTSRSDGPITNPEVSENFLEKDAEESISDAVQNLPLNPSSVILGRIIEKKHNWQGFASYSSDVSEKGFPDVFLVDQKSSGDGGSLFWQNLSKNTDSRISPIPYRKNPSIKIPEKQVESGIDESLKREIHEDSLKKLSEMSKEEIEEAKSQLENTLSPEMLQFLKTKKKNIGKLEKIEDSRESKMEIDTMEKRCVEMESERKETNAAKGLEENGEKMECEDEKMRETPIGELLEAAMTKGWMHMNTVEREKLEWMKDVVPTNIDADSSNQSYNARFDFNGVLLPFRDDELTVDKGLHHHGEEPERPGYSLQELLQLSRSSTQQQRSTALTTLANIMEKSRKGWYDRALEPAPLVALSEKNIVLLLRFSLDDTSVAIVTAALQALRAFFYSDADEICLDRLAGWLYNDGQTCEPELPAPKTDVSDTSDLKDHELAQLDIVAAAMRSDIVLRIRYILSEMHPPPIGVTAALEILTRLARQSRITALNIACTPRLLDVIVKNFIPLSVNRSTKQTGTSNAYGLPSVIAVRFCRILVSYAGKPVADKLDRLQIVHSLISYTTCESTAIGIRLSIESLRLWKLLLSHNIAPDSIVGARIALLTQLQLLLSNHDLDGSSELSCEHAAALIDVAIHESSLRSYISTLLTKWSTQLGKLPSPTWSQTKLIAVTLTALNDISSLKSDWIANTNIFANLCSTSNLLSGYSFMSVRDPSSLPNLGVLIDDGQSLQPSVSLNSSIPFIATWINVLCGNSRKIELRKLLDNKDFANYTRKLATSDWSLENSWYTRAELFLATGIVRATINLGKNVDDDSRRFVLRIAIKLVSTLPADASLAVKEILGYVINDEILTIEKLSSSMNSLRMNVENPKGGITQDLPKDLSSIYAEYVSSTGFWDQAAMPKDWIYLPLVAAYTASKNRTENWQENDTTRIIVQLSLESLMPEIVADLSPSLRFSRLSLIYLCDTIYLNGEVSTLLNETMKTLLKSSYEKLDFTSDLPGLTSFTDLFTLLCESFCANSYGNDDFSMTLIVPLAQRHDVHYRKLMWSEHAAALRYIRLTKEKLTLPLSEYLHPIESDSSLIESYLTALIRGYVKISWCPLMYEIALHHSAMFIRGDGKLARKMRAKIVELRDRELSDSLLNYEIPEVR